SSRPRPTRPIPRPMRSIWSTGSERIPAKAGIVARTGWLGGPPGATFRSMDSADMSRKAMDSHYTAVERAVDFIETRVEEQPGLADVAEAVGMSPFQCQRLFSRMVGVSPKKFLQFLTLRRAKEALAGAASVLEASFDAGLSGPGRLHDLFVSVEAATPGEYKARGEGMTIRHAVVETPFGACLILSSERGITGLAFVAPGEGAALDELSEPYR